MATGKLELDGRVFENPSGCYNSETWPMRVRNETDTKAEIHYMADGQGPVEAEVEPDEVKMFEFGRSVCFPKASTVPGKTSTVPGKASTVPGETSTVPGETSTVPGKTSTVTGKTSTVTGKLILDGRVFENPSGCYNSETWPMRVRNETDTKAEIHYMADGQGPVEAEVEPDEVKVFEFGRSVCFPRASAT
ncbi:MAG: hypothetical protein ACRDRQ_22115 [Pseudonocardiaceae bacterium]